MVCIGYRRSDFWGPGEALPISVEPQVTPPAACSSQSQSVIDMLQVFQSSMDKQLSTMCEKLETIDSRMIVLETRQKNLEEEIRSGTSCSSSANSTPASGRQRKRITPLALQV